MGPKKHKALRGLLNELLLLLNQSNDSIFANQTVDDIKTIINEAINSEDYHQEVNIKAVRDLLLPTASLQEISIDNGWGKEFCEIASKIEKLI